MRTTIHLDDHLGKLAKKRSLQRGQSLSAYIAGLLRRDVTDPVRPQSAPPFRLVRVGGNGPKPKVDLDRTSQILVDEDTKPPQG